jgi:DNA-binding HxlR family transcriptional regulator
LTGKPSVNGSGNGARSGAQTLVLLAAPLNSLILRALASGPQRQADVRRATGASAQTTLRAQLNKLAGAGAIAKHRRNRFPGVIDYELTQAGRELLSVIATLEGWLAEAPDGPLVLGDHAAKTTVKALAEAWSSTMLRALAAGPLSLTELDRVISSLSYPALERRLTALRLAGLVRSRPADGASTPYAVTDWLRRGLGPLGAAARWERRNVPGETAPIGRLEAEAAFLLAVPLLKLPTTASGRCRMAIEAAANGKRRLAGVTMEVEGGAIVACTTRLTSKVEAWALGSPGAWLDAVVERDSDRLELGGNSRLARTGLDALHRALFANYCDPQRVLDMPP